MKRKKLKNSKKNINIHYAWAVLAGCALLLFCTSGLGVNAFTIYQPYIMDMNAFTNTQTSAIISFRTAAGLVAMLLSGLYYKKLSLRAGMFTAGLCAAGGFGLFSVAKTYPFYCAAACLSGLGYGFGAMIPIGILLRKWFVSDRNLAFGICSAATGFSTLGIPSLISRVVEKYGLSAAFISEAAAVAAVVTVSFLLIRNSPAEKNTVPFGETEEITVRPGEKNGLPNSCFFVLYPAVFLVGGVMSVAYCHISVHITSAGYSPSAAAVASSVSGISLIIGKIIYGRLGDKISNYKSNFIFGSLLISGCMLFCFISGSENIIYAAALMFSCGMAFTSIGLSAWAVDFSSDADCERNIRLFQILYYAGNLVFSPFPGIIADRDGGSYTLSFVLFAVLGLYIFFAVQFCYRRMRNETKKLKKS